MDRSLLLPNDLDVQNVAILVGDAVRWDASNEPLGELGKTYQTVAASHHTPTAFASMLSGLAPTEHGVYGFSQRLPADRPHLLGLDSHTCAFSKRYLNGWLAEEQRIFGEQPREELAEMSPPFVWVNRHHGGHAPYDGFTDDGEHGELNAKEYFLEHAGDTERLRDDYRTAVDDFIDDVEATIEILEAMGIREETLLVVASDHGELLGETGQIGHDFPGCPELVKVPTTFVHPKIETGTVQGGVMRHVDLVPTLLSVLDGATDDFGDLEGASLTDTLPERGLSHYDRSFSDILRTGLPDSLDGILSLLPDLSPRIRSAWDADGGHVFNDAARYKLLSIYLLRVFGMPEGRHIIRTRSFRRAYRSLLSTSVTYGEPSLSVDEARDLIERQASRGAGAESSERELTEDQQDQLEDLGYL